jgi:hypothetical protein
MRRSFRIAMLCLLIACAAAAQKKPEPIDDLRKRAEASSRGDRARLYSELSLRYAELAGERFAAGEEFEAKMSVAESVRSAQEAKSAAVTTKQRLKQTEIALRNTANKLNDVLRATTFENHAGIEQAVLRVRSFQKELLDAMFAKDEEK